MDTDLNALGAFARVAYWRSFRRAAQELQVTPSALSHTISKLEQGLGVRLLNRSTRSVSLSDAGARLLARLHPALEQITQALDVLNEVRQRPMGKLKLNVPRVAAQLVLAPKLAAWLAAYPDVQLDLVTNDALVDIVEQGCDAGIRFGESLQQDMIAVPIGPELQFAVCAAPDYLQRHGTPKKPDELLRHACLQYRFPSDLRYVWQFQAHGKKLDVATSGAFASDDFVTIIQAAVDGAGICYTYQAHVAALIRQGKLCQLLPEWIPPAERMHLYYPSRANLSLSLRAFIDFYK